MVGSGEPVLWGLGWVVSTSIGIAVEDQFSIFGVSGAATFSALSGLLLPWILPAARTNAVGAVVADGLDLA